MKSEVVAQIRRIQKVGIETPILIPSFSSVCDRRIAEIHSNIGGHISDYSLVSAYDLAYKYIREENTWASNLVYIDSGNYEYSSLKNYKDGKNWSVLKYKRLLNALRPLSAVVIVNFDEPGPLDRQISTAKELFASYPSYATCFLCKPFSKTENYINIQTVTNNITWFGAFDVIAFTEKELGTSLVERAKKIFSIRQALTSEGLSNPIHVFGCLDPLAILVFFLCGADIFDGTNWLKFTFYDNLTVYTNDYSILDGQWSESDITVRNSSYVFNLGKLALLTQDMRKYSRERTMESFHLSEKIQTQISSIIDTAQLGRQ